MAYCVNPKSERVESLAKELGISANVTAAKVGHWMKTNNTEDFPSRLDLIKGNQVNYVLDAVDILSTEKATEAFRLMKKKNLPLEKVLADLLIPKAQQEFIKSSGETEQDEIITSLLANYSYAVEINIAMDKKDMKDNAPAWSIGESSPFEDFELDGAKYTQTREEEFDGEMYYRFRKDGVRIKRDEFEEKAKVARDLRSLTPTNYYARLVVPGGTNYIENEIATPAIVPSMRGHAQFATKNGIGWFRSDDRVVSTQTEISEKEKQQLIMKNKMRAMEGLPPLQSLSKLISETGKETKTRRILEVQSDLFQKGRDNKALILPSNQSDITKWERDEENKPTFSVTQTPDEDGKFLVWESFMDGEGVFGQYDTYEEATDAAKKENDRIEEIQRNNPEPKPTFDSEGQKSNNFLQLLNKDNAWVSFFVKAIVQDSAKKGYEKVLFPSGNTASKIEGHSTIEDVLNNINKDRQTLQDIDVDKAIQMYEELPDSSLGILPGTMTFDVNLLVPMLTLGENMAVYQGFKSESEAKTAIKNEIDKFNKKLDDLEYQYRNEGLAKLAPIIHFYETTVQNVIKKQHYNPTEVVDEYGNKWFEVKVEPDLQKSISLTRGNVKKLIVDNRPVIDVNDKDRCN